MIMSLNQLSREALVKGLHQRAVRPFAARLFHASAVVQADDQIECKVNGESVHVPKGSTVMQACDAAGIDIPRYKSSDTLCLSCCCRKFQIADFGYLSSFLQVLLSSEAIYCWQL